MLINGVNERVFIVLCPSHRVQPCSTISRLPSPNPHRASVSSRPKGPLKALNLKLHTDQTPPAQVRRRQIGSNPGAVEAFGREKGAGADGGARTAMASCDCIEMASGLNRRRSKSGAKRLRAGRESRAAAPRKCAPVAPEPQVHLPGNPGEISPFLSFSLRLLPLLPQQPFSC